MDLKKSAGMKGMVLCASDSCHNNGDIGLENLVKENKLSEQEHVFGIASIQAVYGWTNNRSGDRQDKEA